MKPNVLYIDDERVNLDNFKISFDKRYTILIAESAREGLAIMEKHDVHILITDQRMPEMTGLELTKIVGTKYPEIISIILTAYLDVDAAMQAVNQGSVFRYLMKPWRRDELINTIENALYTHQLKVENKNLIIELQESNARLLQEKEFTDIALNSLSDTFLVFNAQTGEPKRWNKAFERITGYNSKQISEMKAPHSFYDANELSESLQSLGDLQQEKETKLEMNLLCSGGEKLPYEYSISVMPDKNKERQQQIWVGRDISERKEVEKILKESEERYHSLFDGSRDGIVIVTVSGGIIDCNKAYSNMLGYSKEELKQKNFYQLTPEKWHDWEAKEIVKKQILVYGYSQIYEKEYIRKNGDVFPIELAAYSEKLSSGETIMWASVREITEQKQAKHAMVESEEKFSKAFHTNPSMMAFVELSSGIISDVNASFEQISGYPRNEIVGKRYNKTKIFGNLDKIEDFNRIIKGEREIRSQEIDFTMSSGENRDFIVSADTLQITGKNYLLIVAGDITERKKAQKALKESEAYYRNLYENISDGIFIIDVLKQNEYIFVGINPAEEKFVNLTSVQVEGKLLGEVIPAESIDKVNAHFAKCINRKIIVDYEEEIDSAAGKKYYLTTLVPIVDDQGKVFRIIGVARDVTEKRLIQQRTYTTIINTEEKERSRIAKDLHDGLGPILSTIKLYVDWLLDPNKKTDNNKILEKVDITLNDAMVSLKEISANLSPHILENYGLIVALKSFIDKINEMRNLEIEFTSNIKERLNTNIETTIYRIIIECLNNSLKYASASKVSITVNAHSDDLSFEYKDDGIGFNIDKVKDTSKGMGMNNIFNRMKIIGGDIDLISEPGKGVLITGRVKQSSSE